MANVSMSDIQQLIADQLGTGDVGASDRIVEDLGAESSDIANIIAAVEDRYGITVSEDAIADINTVQDVFVAVQNA